MESKTVFKATVVILLTLFAAYILFLGAEIIITLLIAIIIASAVRPAVNGLKRIKIPESVAIVIVYGTMALIILTVLFVLIPPMFNQFAIYVEQDWRLASRIITANQIAEGYISDVMAEDISLVSSEQIREAVTASVSEFRAILPNLIQNTGTIIANAVLIFVMGAYWLTSHISAKRFILKLTTPRYRDETRVIINDIEQTLGGFVRSAVIISVIVAILNFLPMYILGVPNALTMAFIIGTMTIIPMVGGLIGGGIATLLTLITDPPFAIIVLITFLIVSQIENYLLQPRIMSDGVGMNPLLVIVYTSIGFVLSGVVGALIAIPIMGAFHILLEHLIIEPYRAQMKDDTPPEDLIVEIEPGDEVTIKKADEEDDKDA